MTHHLSDIAGQVWAGEQAMMDDYDPGPGALPGTF